MTAITVSLVVMIGLAAFHHLSLTSLVRTRPDWSKRSTSAPIYVFTGLVFVHLAEIGVLACASAALDQWLWKDSFDPAFGQSWVDWFYLSGTLYTTLGYAPFDVVGDMRVLTVAIGLVGFMLLTWSATFLYAICSQTWKSEAQD